MVPVVLVVVRAMAAVRAVAMARPVAQEEREATGGAAAEWGATEAAVVEPHPSKAPIPIVSCCYLISSEWCRSMLQHLLAQSFRSIWYCQSAHSRTGTDLHPCHIQVQARTPHTRRRKR